jgi:hypothetical protein
MIISKYTIEEKWDVLWLFHGEIEGFFLYIIVTYHCSVAKGFGRWRLKD